MYITAPLSLLRQQCFRRRHYHNTVLCTVPPKKKSLVDNMPAWLLLSFFFIHSFIPFNSWRNLYSFVFLCFTRKKKTRKIEKNWWRLQNNQKRRKTKEGKKISNRSMAGKCIQKKSIFPACIIYISSPFFSPSPFFRLKGRQKESEKYC